MSRENVPSASNLPPAGLAGRLRYLLRILLDFRVSSVVRDLKPALAGAHGRVLEAGCGAQPYRHMLGKESSYTGLDWSGAPGEFRYQCPDAVLYDGGTFPFDDNCMDVVFHTEVLEHVWDTRLFLGECLRVLRPGGRMFFTVPFAVRYHYIPNDNWRFTRACLERLCAEAGFADVKVAPRGSDLAVAFYKIQTACMRLALPNTGRVWLNAVRVLSALVLWIPFLFATLFGQFFNHTGIGSPDDPLGYFVTAIKPDSQTHQ
jgi:SAM-dependent methyltransferase